MQSGHLFLYLVYHSNAVFLFSILEMGVGPSELGKLVCKVWKLGKLKHTKSTSNTKEFSLSNCIIPVSKDKLSYQAGSLDLMYDSTNLIPDVTFPRNISHLN